MPLSFAFSPSFWMVLGLTYTLAMLAMMWALRPSTPWAWARRWRKAWSAPRPLTSVLGSWGMALGPLVGLVLAPSDMMPQLMLVEMLVSAPCLLRWSIAADHDVLAQTADPSSTSR